MPEEAPFFSIVIPAYNCESYVARSIESVLAQDFQSWELMIVDDCSQDYTGEILKKYAAVDPRIRVLRNERNLNISGALNRGISEARGKWIVRLDSDDFFYPHYLQTLRRKVETLEGNNHFVSAWITVVDEFGKKILDVRLPDAETIHKMMKIENFLYHPATSFPRELWRSVGGYPEKTPAMAEDTAMWLRFFKAGAVLHMIEEPLVHYRIHYSNATSIKDAALDSPGLSGIEMKALRQNREWRISLYLKQKMLKAARKEIMELNRLHCKISAKNLQYYMMTYFPAPLVHFLMWEFRPRLRYLVKNMRGRKIRI